MTARLCPHRPYRDDVPGACVLRCRWCPAVVAVSTRSQLDLGPLPPHVLVLDPASEVLAELRAWGRRLEESWPFVICHADDEPGLRRAIAAGNLAVRLKVNESEPPPPGTIYLASGAPILPVPWTRTELIAMSPLGRPDPRAAVTITGV